MNNLARLCLLAFIFGIFTQGCIAADDDREVQRLDPRILVETLKGEFEKHKNLHTTPHLHEVGGVIAG